MSDIPLAIRKAFLQVKREYAFYVALIKINGNYYVYRRSSKWNKQTHSRKSISEYLGKIDSKGNYIKKEIKHSILPADLPSRSSNKIDLSENKMLTLLSMNARANLSYYGKSLLGLGPSMTFYRVKHMENKYSIKYLTEIGVERLGYAPYIAFVKFEDRMPSMDELREELKNEPSVQIAGMLSGEYDLFIYFLAENNDQASEITYQIRKGKKIESYLSKWYVTPFKAYYGFVPLRDEFFQILKEKVWSRTKEKPHPESNQLTEKEYRVLRELNSSGTKDFSEIDKSSDLHRGGTQYIYHKLKEKGIIRRATLTLDLPLKYSVMLLVKVIDQKAFSETRNNLLSEVISESELPVNKYVLEGDIGAPHGILFVEPIFDDEQFRKSVEKLSNEIKGVAVSSLIITNVLVGNFCYRKFDNRYARHHDLLIESGAIAFTSRYNYDRTAENKSKKAKYGPLT
jgi:DNA-binding Lrp family transcriptional regulator